ncbi:MAG: SMC-Scp complex subunit ScpB [Eggerthellaceae bacterium]|jgi:segregation and condensation protein B
MFEGLQHDQLPGAIEALLFVSDEPVDIITLADILEVTPADVQATLLDLQNQYEEEKRGIKLRELAGGWQFRTHPVYHELLEAYVLSWDTRKLSQAAIETLAIVAYGQPMTRATVASIRGVNSDSSINSLMDKGLLREVGSADTPGNPILYGTSKTFLEHFGLRSLEDLPPLEEFAPDEKARDAIRERLSATKAQVTIEPEASLYDDDKSGEPFEDLHFDFDGDGEVGISTADTEGTSSEESMRRALSEAAPSSFGLTEKVDFDSLDFDTDDE